MQIWRYALAHEVRRGTLSVQGSLVPLAPLPLTLCEGRIGCAGGVGDYQIAPIAARSTAMGRWQLTPPGYGGICLPAGRSVRGSDTPPACHSIQRTPGGRLEGCAGRVAIIKSRPLRREAPQWVGVPCGHGVRYVCCPVTRENKRVYRSNRQRQRKAVLAQSAERQRVRKCRLRGGAALHTKAV